MIYANFSVWINVKKCYLRKVRRLFFKRVNGKCQFEGVRNEKDRINFDVVDGIVGIWL